jgi:hypothetical protein
MARGRRFSLLLSLCVLAGGLVAPARAGAAQPLPPDLLTEPPNEIHLVHHPASGRTALRFSNTVSDHGAGPLELDPDPAYTDCDGDGLADDHLALQRVYGDRNRDGVYQRSIDTVSTQAVAGCKVFHAAHDHWHFAGFARYTLRGISNGRKRHTPKVSFCMLDGEPEYPALPGSPGSPFYSPECGELDPQGISVGWADTYGSGLPGQRINVTGLPRGRYCLSSVADPKNLLTESDDGDNAAHVPLALRPRRLTVRQLAGGCAG